jgi:hypothetical protein
VRPHELATHLLDGVSDARGAVGEVDHLAPESGKLAEPETAVRVEHDQCPVARADRVGERGDLGRIDDPHLVTLDSRQPHVLARRARQQSVFHRATEDLREHLVRLVHSRRLQVAPGQLDDPLLHLESGDATDRRVAELRQHVVAQVGLVACSRRRSKIDCAGSPPLRPVAQEDAPGPRVAPRTVALVDTNAVEERRRVTLGAEPPRPLGAVRGSVARLEAPTRCLADVRHDLPLVHVREGERETAEARR